jgi:hypothetical protein
MTGFLIVFGCVLAFCVFGQIFRHAMYDPNRTEQPHEEHDSKHPAHAPGEVK